MNPHLLLEFSGHLNLLLVVLIHLLGCMTVLHCGKTHLLNSVSSFCRAELFLSLLLSLSPSFLHILLPLALSSSLLSLINSSAPCLLRYMAEKVRPGSLQVRQDGEGAKLLRCLLDGSTSERSQRLSSSSVRFHMNKY